MKLYYLLPFLFLSLTGIAQDHFFPDGIYTDLESLRNRYPALEAHLQVTRRSQGDIMPSNGQRAAANRRICDEPAKGSSSTS